MAESGMERDGALKSALRNLHKQQRATNQKSHILWNSKGLMSIRPMTEELGPGCWSLCSSDERGFSSMFLTARCWEEIKTKVACHLEHPLPSGTHEIFSDGECALMLRSWNRRTFTLALCNGGGWSTQFTVTPVIWRKTVERVEQNIMAYSG